MSACIFPTLDENVLSYVAGMWRGYADAIAQYWYRVDGQLATANNAWRGQRASLFNKWYKDAAQDMTTLTRVAEAMADALTSFGNTLPDINGGMQKASGIITSNTRPASPPATDITYYGTFNYKGNTGNISVFDGFHVDTFPIFNPLNKSDCPEWWAQFVQVMHEPFQQYQNACQAMHVQVSDAVGLLKTLVQIKEVSRNSPIMNSGAPFGSLKDPVWNQLTGGGVFRPALPAGFQGEPFKGKDIPSWYKPSEFTKVWDWTKDHADDIVIAANFLATITGNEEIGAALTAIYSGGKAIQAMVDHDWVRTGEDLFDLVVSVPLPEGTAANAIHLANLPADVGDTIKKLLYQGANGLPAPTMEAATAYAKQNVLEYINSHIEPSAGGKASATVPASVMNQIFSQAIETAGANQSLHAANLAPLPDG